MFLLFFLLLPNTFAQEKTISVEGGTEEFPPGPVVENNQSKSQPVQITQNMKLLLYGFVVMVIIGSFAAKKKKPMMHSEEQE